MFECVWLCLGLRAVQEIDGDDAVGPSASRSPAKSPNRAARCRPGAQEHTDGAAALRDAVRLLDYTSERVKRGPRPARRALWRSAQERSSWLAEVRSAGGVCAVAYLLRCLRFAVEDRK